MARGSRTAIGLKFPRTARRALSCWSKAFSLLGQAPSTRSPSLRTRATIRVRGFSGWKPWRSDRSAHEGFSSGCEGRRGEMTKRIVRALKSSARLSLLCGMHGFLCERSSSQARITCHWIVGRILTRCDSVQFRRMGRAASASSLGCFLGRGGMAFWLEAKLGALGRAIGIAAHSSGRILEATLPRAAINP
jgi:hypothetical protein